jgi:uncharacterized membrane protein YedE/YeeE
MSDLSTSFGGAPRRLVNINPKPLAVALAFVIVGAIYLAQTVSAKQAALYVLGALLGVTLYHAAFGFTSAWRVFIADGRGAGLRAQMLMLAIGVLLFFPALSAGTLFGHPVVGEVSPVGTSVVVGAFIFGIGMQLGGGCASGTLYTVGGGSTRMVVTLIAFIVGSVVGTAHMPFWAALPHLQPISLVKTLGAGPAIALNLVVLAAIAAVTVLIEMAVAAARRRRRARGPQLRDACAVGPSLGHHVGVRAVGRQGVFRDGYRRRELACVERRPERGSARRSDQPRREVGDGYRHRDRRDDCRFACRPLRAGVAPAAALAGRGSRRRTASRLRRTPRVRLQYRRVLQRHRVGQPARLAVARLRIFR